MVYCSSCRSDLYNVRATVRIDPRHKQTSPRRWLFFTVWILVERRKWASRYYSNAPREVGISVACLPPPPLLKLHTTHQLLPHRRCHTCRPPALEYRPSQFSDVGAFVLNIATFVKASLARRRSICRDYCRLQPSQLFRALAILSKWSKVFEPAVGASVFLQPAIVVVEPRESRRDRAHTPQKNAVIDRMNYFGLLPVPSSSRSRKSD